MSRVNADSSAVRSVADALKKFEESIEEAKNNLRQAVSSARENWEDDKGAAVEGEIEEMLNSVNVSEETERISQEATQLADKLDDL